MQRLPLLLVLVLYTFAALAQPAAYFQQEVNFRIDVQLNDSLHSLSAFEEIEYLNNSPDTLTFIWFHIWPNAYSDHPTAFWKQKLVNFEARKYFHHKENHGYIDSLDFKVEGKTAQWEYHPEHVDICKLSLASPLPPGEKITITTPFFVKIPPSDYSRLGHSGQSYQITQWYPKPAVYDQHGWHPMPYLDMGEFYSEFGRFEVNITLPAEYVVGATGNLQTKSEIDWLNRKAEEPIHIDNKTGNLYFQSSREGNKTIQYVQTDIHDFAWFANKSYQVKKSEVVLPHSGRKVTTWAMFTAYEADLWKEATKYINDAVYYYSLWNGDYPYSNCTAVEGALSAGAGMEYPTITIIGTAGDHFSLEEVIMHEVGHNWFYGMWGFNERDYPFLDEGLNTANQLRYVKTKYPDKKMYQTVLGNATEAAEKFEVATQTYADMFELAWRLTETVNLNQAINSASEDFHMVNYGFIAYQKAAHAWHYLRNYLGEKEFDRIMQVFYDEWKFKHPYPEDVEAVFERESGKDLDWFFRDVVGTTKYIDYKVKRAKDGRVLIKNKGEVASPFQLSVSDSSQGKWMEGFKGKKWFDIDFADDAKIFLDPTKSTLDVNRRNNVLDKSQLFPRVKPFKFQMVGTADNPEKSYLFFIPVVGLNGLNGLMPGMAFYNSFIPQKRFQFLAMPMFGTKNQHFAGIFTTRYLARNNVTYQLRLKQFGFCHESNTIEAKSYGRFSGLINYRVHRNKAKGTWTDFTISYVKLSDVYELGEFLNFDISHSHRDKLNPYSFHLGIELAEEFTKFSMEGKMRVNYGKHHRGFDMRIYAGYVDYPTTKMSNIYGLSLAGRGGYADYQASYLFMDRSSGDESNPGLTARQALISDGGFVSYFPDVFASRIVSTLNLKSSLPGLGGLKLFLNLGVQRDQQLEATVFLKDEGIEVPDFDGLQYETGFELSLIPDIFAIYFPVYVSEDIRDVNEAMTDNYWQKIRFTLKLNMAGRTGRVSDYLY